MQSDQEIVLTSLQQYRSEVLSLPRLSASEERDLEQRVRQGDREARKQLVEVGLRYVAGIAWRYLCYVPQDDYLELVSVGNTAVVEGMEKALSARQPSAYLRGLARGAIRRYCLSRSRLVDRPPSRRQRSHRAKR
jgi:DNA-directed RNA polymerase sigma subunit (sigma70/sigma32)